MRVLLLLVLFFWNWWSNETIPSAVVMQEICDNGIDDDMDGLIDLNDTADCFCDGLADTLYHPSSLIPNPSFEDTLCCPQQLADLECAKDWIQASWATSDFFHTCGFESDPARGTPPQPLPSGNAYVGFLDVSEVFGIGAYKEYVGACLTERMTQGQDYTLQFYLGFGTPGRSYAASSPIEIVLYGTNDCAELPFGQNLYASCPSGLPEWFEIGSVVLSGRNEWVRATINFTAPSAVEAVAIGPGCDKSDKDSYYFLDDLILNESEAFNPASIEMLGEVCDSSVTLSANVIPGLNYQWFKDGIAVIGATDTELMVTNDDAGEYIVRIDNGIDCELSEPFAYFPTFYHHTIDTVICQGDVITLEGQQISNNFQFEFSYPSLRHCDSVVEVKVTVLDSTVSRIDTTICSSQNVILDGAIFDIPGNYKIKTLNHKGCDSIIYLHLEMKDTLYHRIDTIVCEGSPVVVNGVTYNDEGEFEQNEKSSEGCEIKWEIDITYRMTSSANVDTILCQGQTLIANGQVILTSGEYPVTKTSVHGCDSIILYDVEVIDTHATRIDTGFCKGDFIEIQGHEVTKDTSIALYLINANGCDSVVHYNVVAHEFHEEFIDTVICANSTLIFKGESFDKPGEFEVSRTNQWGCDSLWHLTLDMKEVKRSRIDTTLCPGEILHWNGQSFDQSIDDEFTLQGSNGCDSIVSLALTIVEDLDISVTVLNPISCFEMGDGHVRIDGIDNRSQVFWSDGYIGTQRSGLDTTSYQIIVTSDNECEAILDFKLEQPEALELDVVGQNPLCQQDESGMIIIQEYRGGTGQLRLYLNGELVSNRGPEISGLRSGIYEVLLMDENDCSVSEFVELSSVAPGKMQIITSAQKVVLGDSVELSVSMEGISGVEFIDWFGPSESCLDCYDWTVYPPKGRSSYEVIVKDVKGCEYYDLIELEATSQYFVPNVFSPNGDGINDFFTLYSDRSIQEIINFQVYDRWGELVHQTSSVLPGQVEGAWDGYLSGRLLNPGVYVYVMEVLDKDGNREMVSGDVTLLN